MKDNKNNSGINTPRPIPMRERWKHDIPKPIVIGYVEFTEEEKDEIDKLVAKEMEKERKLLKEFEDGQENSGE